MDRKLLAQALRHLADEVEAGRVDLEAAAAVAEPARRRPMDEERAARAKIPDAFGTLDGRAPAGCAGLVVGGRTLEEVVADERGLRWLAVMHARGTFRSDYLRAAAAAMVEAKRAEIEALRDMGRVVE